jgi:outer membrane lipoprotein-sorting protein
MLRPCLLLLTATLATAAPDPAPLDAWLAKQKDIRSIQSSFVQERKLPSLKNPVTAKGTLWFKRPGLLRWELGAGPDTLAISDGTTLTIVDATEKCARRIPVNDPQARQFTLLAGEAFRDLAAFRSTFELSDSRVTSGIYQATLRPLDRRLRAKVPWVFLDIQPGNSRLRALELQLSDGSRIRSIFSNTSINPSLPASNFQFDLTGYKVR